MRIMLVDGRNGRRLHKVKLYPITDTEWNNRNETASEKSGNKTSLKKPRRKCRKNSRKKCRRVSLNRMLKPSGERKPRKKSLMKSSNP